MHRSTTTTNPIDVDWSQLHRHGAEAARGAHNSEVTGSKPVAGIYYLSALKKPMVIARATINMSNTHPFSSAAEHPGS